MINYIIKKVRRNGKNQLFITFKDGDADITVDDYVVIRKITPSE